MPRLAYTHIETPIGPLLLAGGDGCLRHVGFPRDGRAAASRPEWIEDRRPLVRAAEQIKAYFAGERTGFDLPLAFSGNAFEEAVWRAMAEIPYGATASYGDVARTIGETVVITQPLALMFKA